MIKISNYQTQIKCIRLTLTRKHREQNAYGYGSWRKHIKKIIDLWSISFKLVDFTLRNCTRVQPYVFTTLSGLFSHQSLKIWLSNKISSIHSSIVLPVPFQSGFLLVHVWFKYVIVWMKVCFLYCSWIFLATHWLIWIKWDHFEHLEYNNHHCLWLITQSIMCRHIWIIKKNPNF